MPPTAPMPARRLLAALLLPLGLAACSGTSPSDGGVLGARGPVADAVRGAAPSRDDVLRPEPGDIWTEGLQPGRAPAAR